MAITYKYIFHLNADTEVTSYVTRANWGLGLRDTERLIADENRLSLTLDNSDKRFSPEFATGPYFGQLNIATGVTVQFKKQGGSFVNAFKGWIEAIVPSFNENGDLLCTIEATGPRRFLKVNPARLKFATDLTANQVITNVLNAAEFPSFLPNVWYIGISGKTELGDTTFLANVDLATSFETGVEVFPFVGDSWQDSEDGYGIISAAAESERGVFFVDRGGTATFWNREHIQKDFNNDGTITKMSDMDYAYGARIHNHIEAGFTPRTVSATETETLWTLDQPLTIIKGGTATVNATYGGSAGERIAGENVTVPNTSDGSLAFTGNTSLSITMVESSTSSELTIVNTGRKGAKITTLTLKGRKYTTFRPITIIKRNEYSVARFHEQAKDLRLDMVGKRESVERMAEYELETYKEAQGLVESITVMNREIALENNIVDFTIGTRIQVTDVQTAHTNDYIIIGEEHTVEKGAKHHITRWYLREAQIDKVWLIGTTGFGELSTNTILGL